jgi:hypothetical protein
MSAQLDGRGNRGRTITKVVRRLGGVCWFSGTQSRRDVYADARAMRCICLVNNTRPTGDVYADARAMWCIFPTNCLSPANADIDVSPRRDAVTSQQSTARFATRERLLQCPEGSTGVKQALARKRSERYNTSITTAMLTQLL